MIPKRNNFDLWEDIFRDPFFTRNESKVMKTDIIEHEAEYQILVDLPGYEKEDIKIEVENGYLTIHATSKIENEEKKEGNFVRKERYFGDCSRSFYVGEEVEAEEIKASFKNGTLTLAIPKKDEQKEKEEKKYISISE